MDLAWDPFDTDIDDDPHPTWRRLRDEAPVYRNDKFDFFALSRYADVEAAHRDPRTFSSAQGTVLELMGNDLAATEQMIFLDPPEHTRLRHLVSRAFTPRRVAELEGRVRAMSAGMLDPQVGGDGFDYLQDFGARLPSMVISSLLGVPGEDQETFRHTIDRLFHIEPDIGMVNEVSMTAGIELTRYLAEQLEQRLSSPRDDLLTALVEAEITDDDGTTRRLTRSESAAFAVLLLSAGTETVARLLGWAAVILAAHPEQRAELAADPALIPNAIEELLRYEAPSPVQGRWTTTEVKLHGEAIPKDSKVLLLTGSAGRDEREFPEADRFDIHRDMRNHVSFGYGIHFCVGAALARLEGRVALEETLQRFPEWDVDHDRAVRLHTSTVRGYAEVPIVVASRGA
ncbi:MAG TPA: cytochrome P450 [Acidimicrobiales bacterium]|nr:cytochrome P450 [Acidimicrobiales bacterium]